MNTRHSGSNALIGLIVIVIAMVLLGRRLRKQSANPLPSGGDQTPQIRERAADSRGSTPAVPHALVQQPPQAPANPRLAPATRVDPSVSTDRPARSEPQGPGRGESRPHGTHSARGRRAHHAPLGERPPALPVLPRLEALPAGAVRPPLVARVPLARISPAHTATPKE